MHLISICVLPPSLGNLRAPVYCLPESLQLHLPPSFPSLPGFVSLLCIKSRCFSSGSSQRGMIPSIAPPAQTLPHQINLKSFEKGSLYIPFITYITIYIHRHIASTFYNHHSAIALLLFLSLQ